jgi:hypothetical protein
MGAWPVLFHSEFMIEFETLPETVQDELLVKAALLGEFGPTLRRPHADTLNRSKHANMKELRFEAGDGVWRAAYAFDPVRRAIILVAGDKSGGSTDQFYRRLIEKADRRFDQHLLIVRKKRN